jgi:hypothetical protein
LLPGKRGGRGADTIVNGGETTRLCTKFAGCVHNVGLGDVGSGDKRNDNCYVRAVRGGF